MRCNSVLFLDMRKALSKDVKKKSVIPLTHPVRPEEVDWNMESLLALTNTEKWVIHKFPVQIIIKLTIM